MDQTLKYTGLAGIGLVVVGGIVQVLVKMLAFIAGAAFMAGIGLAGVVSFVWYRRYVYEQSGGIRAYQGRNPEATPRRRSVDETRRNAQRQARPADIGGDAAEYVETSHPNQSLP